MGQLPAAHNARVKTNAAVRAVPVPTVPAHIGQVINDREVDSELFVVLEVDAHDNRFDPVLHWPDVDVG